ncbi:BolA family protein [Entomobacter blattae]|nr:BolA family protein [Entomobacter blattae]
MKKIVETALAPQEMAIEDESHRHAHHSAVKHAEIGGGETHYRMVIVSQKFMGMNRVQRSRLVHELLREEFTTGLHALALTLKTPEEYESLPKIRP